MQRLVSENDMRKSRLMLIVVFIEVLIALPIVYYTLAPRNPLELLPNDNPLSPERIEIQKVVYEPKQNSVSVYAQVVVGNDTVVVDAIVIKSGLTGEESFKRGQRYFHQGMVLNPHRAGLMLKAQCQGSRSQPYRVQVTLEPTVSPTKC